MIAALFIGLIVGAIAKFLMPGKDPGGIFVTIIIGIIGSMLANFIGSSMGLYAPNESPGWIASIIGSMLLLGIYRLVVGRNRRALI
jgi:uncharacterized membrane protein YeaQ/YmgE (transglycosylase-associated protein family)